jgi:hypothetical protein
LSFGRRYLESLLSAEPHPLADPEPRRVPGVKWWRRYLASLFDMPLASGLSRRAVLLTDPDAIAGGRAPSAPKQPPNTVFRATPTRAPALRPVVAAARRRSGQPLAPLIGLAAALAVVVGTLVVQYNSPQRPSTGAPAPVPTGTVGGVPTESPEPSPSGTTDNQAVWQGTLTFVARPGMNGAWSLVANPRISLLEDSGALVLCTSSCPSPNITGQAVVAWTREQPPTRGQCAAQLADMPPGSIPLRPGQMACFSVSGSFGFLTVRTAVPAVSASGIIWLP